MKLIVRNKGATIAKYGPKGIAVIDAAIARLTAADQVRSIATKVVDIDDAAAMTALGLTPVTVVQSARQVKQAIDGLDRALHPDFIVLLDGPDVIPHVDLKMPAGLSDDPDRSIPSDLPYACNAGYGTNPASFGAVTRVLGRIPGPIVASVARPGSPDFLVRAIDRAANHRPAAPTAFDQPFAISAEVWRVSTELSVSNVFGPDPVLLSPPHGPLGLDAELARAPHFINCHGADSDVNFYGQSGADFPVALNSADLAGKIAPGTVVAAECCYGAQMFDPMLSGGDLPICLRYLDEGAIGFMGSTNVAYGPADANGQADLITQYFLANVRNGLSLGRALLEARQEFVRTQSLASPTNLKTFAQFLLLGDPSLQACDHAAAPVDVAIAPSPDVLQVKSRADLKAAGLAAAAQALYLTDRTLDGEFHAEHGTKLRALAERYGFSADRETVLAVRGGGLLGRAIKDRMEKRASVVYSRRVGSDPGSSQELSGRSVNIVRIQILNVTVVNDRLVKVELCESR